MGDYCKDLKVIPQFVGSCWFNSILMSFLYSQYSRKLLLNKRLLGKKDDKLAIVLNNVLLVKLVWV